MGAGFTVRIDSDGNTHIDVSGVQGATCENLTQLLIQQLGEVEQKCYTEEFHQEEPDWLTAEDGGLNFNEEE